LAARPSRAITDARPPHPLAPRPTPHLPLAPHPAAPSPLEVALTAFREGRLLLNGAAVEETRCLRTGDVLQRPHDTSATCPSHVHDVSTGDVLELLHDAGAAGRTRAAGRSARAPIVLHSVEAELAVVWKPAGCKSLGEYPGTLQDALRTLLPPRAPPAVPADAAPLSAPTPLSRLEGGCTGVALVARSSRMLAALDAAALGGGVRHTFVALVHGRVPEAWGGEEGATVLLPGSRPTWRRGGRRAAGAVAAAGEGGASGEEGASEEEEVEEEEEEEEGGTASGSSADVTAECPVHVMVVSATAETSPVQLTTLRLVSGGRRGRLCGDLCFFLRAHAGCPVVGDRYARRERGELPRYCNALRKSRARPQISCIGVGVGGGGVEGEVRVELAVPPRLLASTWSTPEAARGARGECGLRGVSDPF